MPPATYYQDEHVTLYHGDCLEELKKLDDNSVDAVITDPPYGLSNTKPAQVADVLAAWINGDTVAVPSKRGGFMGKDWDSFVPPPAVWQECLRVLKPGGHMAVFAGSRTQDLMGLSIRLAGFEIRDTLGWIYGSGFPKSMDIAKAIDKRPGVNRHRDFAEHLKERREAAGLSRQDVSEHVVGTRSGACWNWEHHQFPKYEWWPALRDLLNLDPAWGDIVAEADREVVGKYQSGLRTGPSGVGGYGGGGVITTSSTDAAKRWDGWGTALKPAIEPIILARKPLAGTVAANVLEHGVGGLNIDACRVRRDEGDRFEYGRGRELPHANTTASLGEFRKVAPYEPAPAGRFPANVLLDEHAAAEMDKQSGVSVSRANTSSDGRKQTTATAAMNPGVGRRDPSNSHNDSGGASQFFPVFKYQAKAPKRERPVIVRDDGTKVQHPTVKPLALMEWLCNLIAPPEGVILDPFAGTGTTLQAATNTGHHSIGVEADSDYVQLIRQRLQNNEQPPHQETLIF